MREWRAFARVIPRHEVSGDWSVVKELSYVKYVINLTVVTTKTAIVCRPWIMALALLLGWTPLGSQAEPMTSPVAKGPRKVIVGTTIFSVFELQRPYESLEKRLEEIAQRLGEMDAEARVGYGRGLDVAVFPELSLNRRDSDKESMVERAVPLTGQVQDALGAMARVYNTYLVVSFNLRENDGKRVSNAAVVFDRKGELLGIYRKAFLTPKPDGTLEGGKISGSEFPVFETDFGRMAVAICFDMGFDEVMQAYADKGAEVILWPSMSPQTLMPRFYAKKFGIHIVSATPRDNASVFDPSGQIAAQTTREGALAAEIDLDFRVVHFQPRLRDGQALKERFGDRVGFRYSTTEDRGIFWSNDPALPIETMLQEIGVLSEPDLRSVAREKRNAALKASTPAN